MISTSGVVLTTVLERRFGVRWLRRWQSLADEETRWLILYLADECGKGAALNLNEEAILAIMAGRAKLPPTRRSDRSAASLLCTLCAAQVWPLPQRESRTISLPLTPMQASNGLGLDS